MNIIKIELPKSMYKIRLSNNAEKELDKFNYVLYDRIYQKIKSLENNPRPFGAIKLSDVESYRVRVGNYRIIYEINDKEKTIDIYDVLHRKDSYKKK